MRRYFLAVVAVLLVALFPSFVLAAPDYGEPGEGRVRVLVSGAVRPRGHYWLNAKSGFREFMEGNLVLGNRKAPRLVQLKRDGKTLFFGGGLPVGDPAYGIELQEGDTIGVAYVDYVNYVN